MIIGVLKEPFPETRTSLLPEHVAILKKWNVQVVVEDGAGVTAFANNDTYVEAGATITNREEIVKTASLILSINNFSDDDILSMNGNAVLLGVYQPLFHYLIHYLYLNQ